MQNIVLDDWQKEVVDYNDGDILLCTGRQIGKTLTLSIKAAEYMMANPESQIIVVSLTEDQAKLIIAYIYDYLFENYKPYLIAKGKNKTTSGSITLKNKSRVISRPIGFDGSGVRGYKADVLFVDEAARMSEMAWRAIKPTLLSTGGRLWMCSTPFGRNGYFYECFLNKENRFKIWHKSSEEVIMTRPIAESWSEDRRAKTLKFLEYEKKDKGTVYYGQEFMALFLEELSQFFPDELIARCCQGNKKDRQENTSYFAGCDLARLGGDETTIEIIEKKSEKGKLYHVHSIVRKGLLTTENEQLILDTERIWNFAKIGIDAGSGTLGVSIYDHLLEKEETRRKVIAMNNRRVSMDREGKKTQRMFKEDMYDLLRASMERGDIVLLDDSDVKLSLKSVQWEIVKTPNQLTKVRIHGSYTHIAEGIVRAVYLAMKEKNLNLWISYI